MKTKVTIHSIKFAIGGLLFALAFTAQAETSDKVTVAPTEQTHAIISAESVLQHNKRLLDSTTIGKDLKTSDNQRVRDLYKRAYDVFLAATDAHKSGLEKAAKDLSHKSISIFYAADKAHYNIARNF